MTERAEQRSGLHLQQDSCGTGLARKIDIHAARQVSPTKLTKTCLLTQNELISKKQELPKKKKNFKSWKIA